MDIADQKALLKGHLTLPEGGGELGFDDDILDPLQGRLHRLLGQPGDL